MNYEILEGICKTEYTLEIKPDWPPERMRQLALDSTVCDIRNEVGSFFAPKTALKTKEVVLENGKPALNLVTEIKYKYKRYNGLREGTVEIHTRHIAAEIMQGPSAGDVCQREHKLGMMFVKSILPEAVNRVGCYCCYGERETLKPSLSETFQDSS